MGSKPYTENMSEYGLLCKTQSKWLAELLCAAVSVTPTVNLSSHWRKQWTNSKSYISCLWTYCLAPNGEWCRVCTNQQCNREFGHLCFKFSTYNFYLTAFNSHVCFFSAMSTQLIVQMIWSDIKSASHHLCKLTSSPNTALFCPLIITSKDCQLSYIVRT